MNIASILQAIVLGVVQGLTEFIPVSSSGHLEIVPDILGWPKLSTSLILFAHFGTLLSLLVYFRHDIKDYLKSIWLLVRRRKLHQADIQNLHIVRNVLLATIPAGVLGILSNKYLTNFYDGGTSGQLPTLLTLVAMGGLGVVFLMSGNWFRSKRIDLPKLDKYRAVIVGASQAFAFMRGVSRSGISLLTAQALGLSRVEAARFSFLMSIPLIAAASIVGIYDTLQLPSQQLQTELPNGIAILIASALSGWIAIRYLLSYLQKNNLRAFGWYRIIFAFLAALLLFT